MSRLGFFNFYPNDFVGDTAHLDAEQIGWYIRILCHLWTKGEAKLQHLPSIAKALPEQWECKSEDLLDLLQIEEGRARSKRLDLEREKALQQYEKRAAAGKKGGEAKALQKQNPSIAKTLLEQCTSNQNQNQNQIISSSFPKEKEEGDKALSISFGSWIPKSETLGVASRLFGSKSLQKLGEYYQSRSKAQKLNQFTDADFHSWADMELLRIEKSKDDEREREEAKKASERFKKASEDKMKEQMQQFYDFGKLSAAEKADFERIAASDLQSSEDRLLYFNLLDKAKK